MLRSSPLPVLAALASAALAVVALALTVGSVDIGPAAVWHALLGDGNDSSATVVRELRLPRAVAAFAVGGLLGRRAGWRLLCLFLAVLWLTIDVVAFVW